LARRFVAAFFAAIFFGADVAFLFPEARLRGRGKSGFETVSPANL
jgi:hypothetical protein